MSDNISGLKRSMDDAYNNQATVSNMSEIRADWAARSGRIRSESRAHFDLRFGEGERERLDLFLASEPNAPTVTYIHGGYWQANDKENYAFVAEGPLSAGFNVAVIEYSIAPKGTIEQMAAEIGRAILWLHRNLGEYEADPNNIYMTGHSSGGHLTACNIHQPGLRGGVAISGVFDLEPMQFTRYNEKLGLSAETAKANSPKFLPPRRSAPLVVAYGGRELPEFRRQSIEFTDAWNAQGLDCRLLEIPDTNHFSVVEALASSSGLILKTLQEMVKSDS